MNDIIDPEPWLCWSCEQPQPTEEPRIVYGTVETCTTCETQAQATVDACRAARFDAAFSEGKV